MSRRHGLLLRCVVSLDSGNWSVKIYSGSRKRRIKPFMTATHMLSGKEYSLPEHWTEIEQIFPPDFWPPFITEYFDKPITQERLF